MNECPCCSCYEIGKYHEEVWNGIHIDYNRCLFCGATWEEHWVAKGDGSEVSIGEYNLSCSFY